MYTSVKNQVTFQNDYFSYDYGRTYEPLWEYYRPPDFKANEGYYSTTYLQTYFDGYGYNFYYGADSYYEYSVNPKPTQTSYTGVIIGCVVFVVVSLLVLIVIFILPRRPTV